MDKGTKMKHLFSSVIREIFIIEKDLFKEGCTFLMINEQMVIFVSDVKKRISLVFFKSRTFITLKFYVAYWEQVLKSINSSYVCDIYS